MRYALKEANLADDLYVILVPKGKTCPVAINVQDLNRW